jgi:hypothetical protein
VPRPLPLVLFGIALLTSGLCAGQSSERLAWPEPQLGGDARLSSIGDSIAIDGVPAHIYRFATDRSPEEVVKAFRRGIGRDFTQAPASAAHPAQTTVGGRSGDFWVTLQLQREGGRTTGTWAATPRFMADVRRTVHRPPGFPSSATLIQQVDSYDDDKRSELAVGVDAAPVDAAAVRLESELRERGFAKEPQPKQNWASPQEYVALFRKSREEVMVSLRQTPTGTAVVVNRISALEELK